MPQYLRPDIFASEVGIDENVPNVSSSSAALVGYAPKGSLSVKLITSTQQFLQEYVVNNKIELANYFHYSALAYLAQGNQLYCKRVVNGALYGGMKVKDSTSGETNESFDIGLSTPAFVSSSGGNNLIYIMAKDPGTWNNNLSIKITNVDAVTYEFDIEVYYTDADAVTSLVETWTVSRKHQTDGYGQQQYLEDKINDYSAYIVVKDDTSQADTIMPKTNSSAVVMAGGSNGSTVTSSNVATGWGAFTTADEYDVRILINGGYADSTVQTAMKTVAEGRKDCLCIFDIPYASINTVANMLTYRSATQNFNSSYCAIYGPWLKINDQYNSQIVNVPPSGYVAGQLAYNDSVAEPWTAAAGLNRGLLNVLGLSFGADTTGKKAFTTGELDSLYAVGINPIQKKPGLGIAIWGNKTEQVKASATDRVNVRRSLIVIEKAITTALNTFLFELNSSLTRFRVKATLDEYLGRLAARGAFQQEAGDNGFLVVCDTTNNTPATIDSNELHVWVYLKPARCAEFIILKTIITKSGTNLQELAVRGNLL